MILVTNEADKYQTCHHHFHHQNTRKFLLWNFFDNQFSLKMDNWHASYNMVHVCFWKYVFLNYFWSYAFPIKRLRNILVNVIGCCPKCILNTISIIFWSNFEIDLYTTGISQIKRLMLTPKAYELSQMRKTMPHRRNQFNLQLKPNSTYHQMKWKSTVGRKWTVFSFSLLTVGFWYVHSKTSFGSPKLGRPV